MNIQVLCKYILLCLGLFMANNLFAINNLSLADRLWIKQHILKPEAQLIFILSVKHSISNDSYLSENPEIKSLLNQAKKKIVSADFKQARLAIDRAYELAPERSDLYLTELMYQFYFSFIAYNQDNSRSRPETLSVSCDFFNTAIREHPSLDSPVKFCQALTVLKIFYSTLLNHTEQFKQRKAFDFKISPELVPEVSKTRDFFRGKINSGDDSSYFSGLCLLMLAIVENNAADAQHYYNVLIKMPEANNDLYRLMTIYEVSRANFFSAIHYMNKSIKFVDNHNDRQLLARLYSQKGDNHQAIKVLQNYSGQRTASLMVHQFAYILLSGNFHQTNQFYQQLKQYEIFNSIPDFNYYALVIELLNNNYNTAQSYFDKLKQSEELLSSAQLFMQYFNIHPKGETK